MSKAGKAVARIACVRFEADQITQHRQNLEATTLITVVLLLGEEFNAYH